MAQNYDLTQTGPELQARVDQVFPNRDAIEQETVTREAQDESLETSLKAYTDTEQARAEAVEGALDTRVSANEVDIDLLKSQYEALTQSDIIVGPLPSTGQPNKIYRVPGSTYYTDYMWANGGWVKLAEYSTLDGYVYKGIATPSGTPVQSAEAVFYFAVQPGTYTNYGGLVVTDTIAILKYNGTDWTKDDLITIDDEPTAGSDNLVTSGAVAASVVYDISAANAVGGQLATYADLAAALNGGSNVPVELRKGGMEIKFVQSSDNKYVQYRLMADEWSTTVANWQGVDDVPTAGSENLVKSGGVAALGEKTRLYFNPIWRDDRRLYYDSVTKAIKIIGIKTAPQADPTLCIFKYKGKGYSFSDTVESKSLSITSPNVGLFLPESSNLDTTYTLSDIVAFEDANEHTGYFKIGWIVYTREVSGDLISNIENNKFDVLPASNIDDLKTHGIYHINTGTNSYYLAVSDTGSYIGQVRFGASDYYANIEYRQFKNNSWTNWTDYDKKALDAAKDPILRYHTNEQIWWRGTARLFWDAASKTLYWSDGTVDTDNVALILKFNDVQVKLANTVKSRVFNLSGNSQLLLPLDSTQVYTVNDIIVQQGTTYDISQYVKLAHVTFDKAMSSLAVDTSQLDIKIDGTKKDVYKLNLDFESLDQNHNYNQDVLSNKNILDTGIIQDYAFGGRGAFFFKLPVQGEAPIISGCTVLAYQWYSGVPDYINGTNSLGRTMSNTPPSNALYGGLTIDTLSEYSNIYIKANSNETESSKQIINLYGSNLNNSIGENCFANGIRTNLKILGYGNSFMRNTVCYLSSIAKGCGVNLTVGNLYTGGTELQDHLSALQSNSAVYEWHKYVDGAETQSQVNQTAMRGLLDERWDAIIIHQYIPWQYPFEPTLNQFLKLIIERIGYTPKIYINATWAGSLDNKQTYYGFDTEEEMWQAMLNAVKGACADSGVQEYSIIPTGTAIQNARTLSWADSYNRFVNAADNDWHHLNPAGGFIAACTAFQKIVTPLNGVPCSNTTFRIPTSTSLPPQTAVEEGIIVTDSNYLQLCEAAIDAVNNPFVITEQ